MLLDVCVSLHVNAKRNHISISITISCAATEGLHEESGHDEIGMVNPVPYFSLSLIHRQILDTSSSSEGFGDEDFDGFIESNEVDQTNTGEYKQAYVNQTIAKKPNDSTC
jgi:hypothetical protein